LEEDALLTGGPGAVVRTVLLPRAGLASAAAAGWVAVTAATEIPVTDAMMVRTFAEEVYTQFVSATEGLAAAVAVTVPVWAATAVAAGWLARPVVRTFGEPAGEPGIPVNLRFPKRVKVAAALGLWAAAVGFAGLPVAAVVWKAGGGGTRFGWEVAGLAAAVGRVLRTDGGTLAGSVGSAAAAGGVAAGLAWVACRFAGESRGFARFLFVLCVGLWVTPGPLVGLGLKRAVALLLDAEDAVLSVTGVSPDFPPVRSALYDQPSPVPAGWAAVVRFFPVAVAVLWPAVRAVPRELLDAAKLDGVGVWKFVLIPLTGSAAVRAAIAVGALALGEVSAGKLVNPPFRSAYILRLFDQMHYGADSTVAALCLVQIVSTAAIAAGILNIKPQYPSERPP
jgi:iron(III) transport system permease protein